ncbi:hypothetical protein Acr_18g0010100 [Actinidia rufa]|uniref:Uncharacterized protein n=1 Tax=Actinidia rufa TaxID=165716 RepID=A0A7J0G7S0_9ERIC|nr:hypothetical protein Acr_18g0010100 [Actinidia rufa]
MHFKVQIFVEGTGKSFQAHCSYVTPNYQEHLDLITSRYTFDVESVKHRRSTVSTDGAVEYKVKHDKVASKSRMKPNLYQKHSTDHDGTASGTKAKKQLDIMEQKNKTEH